MTLEMKERIRAMSIPSTGSIRQAMQAIDRGALGMALLIEPDTKRFIGLVTDGDIRRALLKGYGLESPVANVPRPEPKTARLGMSQEQITALFSDPVRVVPLLNDKDQVVDLALFDRRVHLPVAEPSLGEKELLYVTECVLTGWISSAGKFVNQFEEMFAEFCGTRYAIATSSGTTALHLALLALGIGPGDEVIVPTLTFIATANAVTYTGACPVFVDSDPLTWNINPNLIEEAITLHTKAIMPVHLYGHPADMDPILQISGRHHLAVIEDAAEAHGARYKGRRVGGIADLGVFSFFGNKIFTTGEGGMVVTNRADLADKIRMLRNHGMSPMRRYWHPVLGYNYRLTNLQAAIGLAQLEKEEAMLSAKRRIAQAYTAGLQEVRGICLPPEAPWAFSVYWLYSILVDAVDFGHTRDDLMIRLQEQGIETRPLFPPIHTQPIYCNKQRLPVAEHLAATGLSLPSAVGIKIEDVNWVVRAIVSMRGDRPV
jgi:perosamine synthetase